MCHLSFKSWEGACSPRFALRPHGRNTIFVKRKPASFPAAGNEGPYPSHPPLEESEIPHQPIPATEFLQNLGQPHHKAALCCCAQTSVREALRKTSARHRGAGWTCPGSSVQGMWDGECTQPKSCSLSRSSPTYTVYPHQFSLPPSFLTAHSHLHSLCLKSAQAKLAARKRDPPAKPLCITNDLLIALITEHLTQPWHIPACQNIDQHFHRQIPAA